MLKGHVSFSTFCSADEKNLSLLLYIILVQPKNAENIKNENKAQTGNFTVNGNYGKNGELAA